MFPLDVVLIIVKRLQDALLSTPGTTRLQGAYGESQKGLRAKPLSTELGRRVACCGGGVAAVSRLIRLGAVPNKQNSGGDVR